METKKCSKCQEEKILESFYKDGFDTNGEQKRNPVCAVCCREAHRKYWTPEKRKIWSAKYKQKPKDEAKERLRKDKQNAIQREKRKNDPEYRARKIEIARRHRESEKFAKNADKRKAYREEYEQKRKPKRNLQRQKRRQTDLQYKITENLRGRLYHAIKQSVKSEPTKKILGCSIDCLLSHLESLWQEGMTWENYGTGTEGRHEDSWHVDHIIPCANFDLSDPEQQKICFNYTNLQPLWGKDNLKKSSKIIKSD